MTASIRVPLGRRRKGEFTFKRFFEMGLDESASPFLTAEARALSKNLYLKVAFCAAFLLAMSFFLSLFFPSYPAAEILLSAVYLMVGVPSLIESLEDLFLKRDVNIDVLMTLAAFSAYFLGSGFEGGLLLVLFALSGALEEMVSLKAKSALGAIHTLAPTKAYLLDEQGYLFERAVQDVTIGTTIFVQPHEIIPLDGIIIDGESFVSMAHLTGESAPVRKKRGDEVSSGGKLLDGSLKIQVTHTSLNSTVSRIVELITQAESAKPRLERVFDRLSRRYALSIMSFFAFFALFAPYFLNIEYLGREGSLYRALSFLIAASPCALILAVPIAYLSTLSALARKGIVLKGGVVVDALNRCSMVAFDKTGTLTLGELSLLRINHFGKKSFSDHKLLTIAASLERNAGHPIAKAIVSEAEKQNCVLYQTQNVRVVPGFGVEGEVLIDGVFVPVFVGDCSGRIQGDIPHDAEAHISASLMVGSDVWLFTFEDTPRPSVAPMLKHLKQLGKQVIMLTGDKKSVAKEMASLLGIDSYEAELKPEDKLSRIEELSQKHGLAMVGDGINDAPALARSSVGICMGKVGSSAAQEVADVILLRDNIELLDWLFEKAHKTSKIVFQNVLLAACAIIGASLPALCGFVPLWLAVILHEGGTVIVGLNAIRLLKD